MYDFIVILPHRVGKAFTEKTKQTVEYNYHLNGNMTKDKNNGLDEVQYNYLNLPKKLIAGSQSLEYIYDANGQKLAKVAPDGKGTHYAGSFVYEGNSLKYVLHSEGMVNTQGTIEYIYHIKDHLGNTRLALNSNGHIIDQADYYPFGMLMTKKFSGGFSNKYKYNGKELQDDKLNGVDLDWYDYGARFYDAALGRFTTQDPMAEIYNNQSPYLYAYNNPVRFTDFMGMNAEDKVEDQDPPKKEETKKQAPETDPLMDGWSDEAPKEEEFKKPLDKKPSKEEHNKVVDKMEAGVKKIGEKSAEDHKKAGRKADVMIAEHDAKMEKRRETAEKVVSVPLYGGQILIEILLKVVLPGPIFIDPLEGRRPQDPS